jgi:hypothetical protein
MPDLKTSWDRIPVIIRAVLTGYVVCLARTMVWFFLLFGLNLEFAPSIPWDVPVVTLFLWAYWRYLGGKGWPRSTTETRRTNLRVHGLSGSIWAWALSVDHGEEYVSFAAEIEIERTNAAMP